MMTQLCCLEDRLVYCHCQLGQSCIHRSLLSDLHHIFPLATGGANNYFSVLYFFFMFTMLTKLLFVP